MFSNLYIKIIFLVTAIGIIVGGAFDIKYLQEKNKNIQHNVDVLSEVVKQKATYIDDLKFQNSQIVAELNQAKTNDNRIQLNLQSLTDKYNSENKRRQIQNLHDAHPQVLIDLINKNNECYRTHFSETGKCVNGIFQKQ